MEDTNFKPTTGAQENDNTKGEAFDLDGLLKGLRQKIKEIHVKNIGHGEVESKATLVLLRVSPFFKVYNSS